MRKRKRKSRVLDRWEHNRGEWYKVEAMSALWSAIIVELVCFALRF